MDLGSGSPPTAARSQPRSPNSRPPTLSPARPPFPSLSLHCSCLHWLRAAAVDALQARSPRHKAQAQFPARFQTRVSEPAFHFNCFFASSLSSAVRFFLAPFSFVFCLIPSLQSFRTKVSCSKLAPAVRCCGRKSYSVQNTFA